MIINKFMYTKPKYRCNETVMRYLVFTCGLPMLKHSSDGSHYYFAKTEELINALAVMPFRLKILNTGKLDYIQML